MRIDGREYRTLWADAGGACVHVIDQTVLPHRFETLTLASCDDAARAIADMNVRGAPLIGVAGAFGFALAMSEDASEAGVEQAHAKLLATRPTASNLRWALDRQRTLALRTPQGARRAACWREAGEIAEEDVRFCEAIGAYGARLIADIAAKNPGRPVNILTHCNAGWLATIDWGTALAPIYRAARAGVSLHVWVDETRPRNQGASLTAFELLGEGVPHTVIADNAGGHLMQQRLVDMCIVGSDRVTSAGDVCNKIGTYLKALAAHDNGVPFYAAMPGSTIDWTMNDGVREIPIEQRSSREVTHIAGLAADGSIATVQVTPTGSAAANYAFDVTPAKYVTALITERGVCTASAAGLRGLYPERLGRSGG